MKKVLSNNLEKQVFQFLNELRDSGVTNMFRATLYILEEFTMEKSKASALSSIWMDNFNEDGDYTEVKFKEGYHTEDRIIS